MAQQIYNEGRVTGFSAWEIFARDALDHGIAPEDIPDEHEWLLSMMGRGASVVLKVPGGTPKGIYEKELPDGSTLTAAGVILGSPFMGTCDFDATSGFAKKITSYGPLISNTSTSAPNNSGSNVPYKLSDFDNYKGLVTEFVKINDGIVYTKYAKWMQTPDGSGDPYKDIDPRYATSKTVVRLYISEDIAAGVDISILLTGFDNKSFLRAVSGWSKDNGSGRAVGGSTDVNANGWKDGGMLGPSTIPWASKIILTVPNSAYTLSNTITRTLPADTEYGDGNPIDIDGITIQNYLDYKMSTTPCVDLDSINLRDYYYKHGKLGSSTLIEDIRDVNLGFTSSYNTLIAWYPGMSASRINDEASASEPSNANFFPPALYATKVTKKGSLRFYPIDVAAPGTLKCFTTSEEAYNYTQLMPDNFAVYYNPSNKTYSFVKKGDENINNWYSTVKLEYLDYAPKMQISTNSVTAKLVALTDSTGADYDLHGSAGTIGSTAPSRLRWDDILDALVENKSIDVLGTRLYDFGQELSYHNTIGIDPQYAPITKIGTPQFVINPQSENPENRISITQTTSYGSSLATVEKGKSIKTGTNYIEFTRTKTGGQTENLRLYISTESPGSTNIPVGSIGIGW